MDRAPSHLDSPIVATLENALKGEKRGAALALLDAADSAGRTIRRQARGNQTGGGVLPEDPVTAAAVSYFATAFEEFGEVVGLTPLAEWPMLSMAVEGSAALQRSPLGKWLGDSSPTL